MIEQFAPIVPYEGAGGLCLGWTQAQVEQVTGPLGEYRAVGRLWRRYTADGMLWLYFNGPGDGLEKIVTLPRYGGRLFDRIDTNTWEQDLLWKEPSLVYRENLQLYTTPKGALIKIVEGKAAHITVFDRKWEELCK